MEYVYAAMLLHKAGQKVDEAGVKKVLEAAGVKVDDSRVKALVASLESVNIEDAIKQAAMPVAVAAPAAAHAEKKHEEKPKEEKKNDAEAAAGLGALFG
ncbi:MAG: 50S ribosomal protein P1 [archaeon]